MPLPYHRSQASLSSRRARGDTQHTRNTSLALSPVSLSHYSETDPFLSPTTTRSSPPSPRTFHPTPPGPPSPHYSDHEHAVAFSPTTKRRRDVPHKGLLGQVQLPPSAKRTLTSTWLLLASATAVVIVFAVSLRSTTLGGSGLVGFRSRASKEFVKLAALGDEADKVAAGAGSELSEEDIEDTSGEIPITALPRPRRPDLDDPDARYLGFLPHSGFHNQRIALQNALLLGKLLNRTVLVPPVWIGWPISTQYYSDLRQSWLDIMLDNPSSFNLSTATPDSPLNVPASFTSSATTYPCPTCMADNATFLAEAAEAAAAKQNKWRDAGYEVRNDGYPIIPGLEPEDCKSYSPECRSTYRDTFLSWDFLVDLDRARAVGVDVVDRWDLRERALVSHLGVAESDVYVVEDRETYDFQFSDRASADAPLIDDNPTSSHYKRVVSLKTLGTLEPKVVLLGSLFGTGRVRIYNEPQAHEWSEALGQAMAFRNPWLLRPANAIVARLGGPANYVGVHARVGDGEFARRARANMERAWRELVVREMGVDEAVADEMWELVRPNVVVGRRSERGRVRAAEPVSVEPAAAAAREQVEARDEVDRAEQGAQLARRGVLDGAKSWLPSLGRTADSPSSRLVNLTCRAPLHTDPRFEPFNVPLYLATDARSPEHDLNLRAFFAAFPCTFVLGDFDRPDAARNDGVVVKSVERMGRLVNALDGVPLGRLFLPFLEAIVAAKGRLVVGTEHSTFSSFASTSLHDAYWAE
ncbi:hypothetical protein JCM9279_003230 [Rhodotorula babjevae]